MADSCAVFDGYAADNVAGLAHRNSEFSVYHAVYRFNLCCEYFFERTRNISDGNNLRFSLYRFVGFDEFFSFGILRCDTRSVKNNPDYRL